MNSKNGLSDEDKDILFKALKPLAKKQIKQCQPHALAVATAKGLLKVDIHPYDAIVILRGLSLGKDTEPLSLQEGAKPLSLAEGVAIVYAALGMDASAPNQKEK